VERFALGDGGWRGIVPCDQILLGIACIDPHDVARHNNHPKLARGALDNTMIVAASALDPMRFQIV